MEFKLVHTFDAEINSYVDMVYFDEELNKRLLKMPNVSDRVVKDLNGYSAEEFLSALQDDFMITLSTEPVSPASLHEFGLYCNNQWYILTARKGTWTEDPIGVLDVTIMSDNILDKLLNIKDQRTDKRIDFVGGIRGLKELENRVNSGDMAAAGNFASGPSAILDEPDSRGRTGTSKSRQRTRTVTAGPDRSRAGATGECACPVV